MSKETINFNAEMRLGLIPYMAVLTLALVAVKMSGWEAVEGMSWWLVALPLAPVWVPALVGVAFAAGVMAFVVFLIAGGLALVVALLIAAAFGTLAVRFN